MLIAANELHFKKADFPIFVIVLGIVMAFSEIRPQKAESAIWIML